MGNKSNECKYRNMKKNCFSEDGLFVHELYTYVKHIGSNHQDDFNMYSCIL